MTKLYALFVMLFSVATFVGAQTTLKINGGNFKVNQSTVVKFENTQFVNNGSFSPGTGTVIISGNSTDAQSAITGTSPTTFYNLQIDKTANGSQLEQNIQVDNELQMTSGNLNLNGFDIVLGSANGSIEGESDASYIYGNTGEVRITKDVNAPTTESFGNIGVIITLPGASGSLGSTTIRRGHAVQDIDGEASILRFYIIEPTTTSNIDAVVEFRYLDHELNGITESDLAPYRFNGSTWDEFAVSGSNETTNFVTTDNVTAFSPWTLGAQSPSAVPVELLEFIAEKINNAKVELSWKTASEINNDYFTVERSPNGLEFESLEQIPGAGNSQQELSYQTYDLAPNEGLNYYRLQQTDFDGTSEYSPVRVVEIDKFEGGMAIFPNPSVNYFQIQIDQAAKGTLELFDQNGKILRRSILKDQLTTVQVQDLPKGTYTVRLKLDGKEKTYSRKIIIQ